MENVDLMALKINGQKVQEFCELFRMGRSAALDVDTITGEIYCACTRPFHGESGKGTPPAVWGGAFRRIAEFRNGEFLPPKWF